MEGRQGRGPDHQENIGVRRILARLGCRPHRSWPGLSIIPPAPGTDVFPAGSLWREDRRVANRLAIREAGADEWGHRPFFGRRPSGCVPGWHERAGGVRRAPSASQKSVAPSGHLIEELGSEAVCLQIRAGWLGAIGQIVAADDRPDMRKIAGAEEAAPVGVGPWPDRFHRSAMRWEARCRMIVCGHRILTR